MTGMKEWGRDLFGGGKKQQPRPSANISERNPSLREGTLFKRGPNFGFKWEQRWCVLEPTRIVWYTGQRRWEKKGELALQPVTKATHFQKPSAPGDAVKHRGEKPHGFVLDSDPKSGKGRHLLYFDAGTYADLVAWTRSINEAAKALKADDDDAASIPAAARPMTKAGAQADMHRLLQNLEDKATDMRTEAAGQGELLQQLHEKTEATQARVADQRKRVRKL